MIEFADIIPQPEKGVSLRRARVISTSGPTVTVDMGGSAAGITIERAADCHPVPNQYVLILVDGLSMIAVSAIGGQWRQSAVTVTSVSETAVGGLVNGSPLNIIKMGAFTPAVGDTLPLIWSASGDSLWAGPKPGVAYVPPPPGGGGGSGGGGGGGGGVTTGTATYAATWAGTVRLSSGGHGWTSGGVTVPLPNGFFYGAGRFRELQGRTITGFRVSLPWLTAGGSVSVYGHPHGAHPGGATAPTRGYSAGSVGPAAWSTLPLGLANYLIGGSGTGGLTFAGDPGTLHGVPYGTLQFDWRK